MDRQRGVEVRRWALVVLLGLASWAGSTARTRAEDVAPGEQAPEDSRYTQLVSEALREYQLQHWTEARTLMSAAHELEPSARTLRGLAMVAFEMRSYADAAELTQQAMADPRKPLSAAQRKEAAQLLQRARRYLGYYRVKVGAPWEDVQVEVDGRPARLDPQGRVVLVAGEHSLRVRAEGARSFTRRVDVRGGEQETLVVSLEPVASDGAGSEGTKTAGGQSGEAVEREEREERDARTRRKQAYSRGLGIGGGVLLVACSVTGGLALKAAGESLGKTGPEADKAKALAWATDVTLGVGIAAAAAAVFVRLFRSEHPAPAQARVRPKVSPQVTRDTVGLALSGAF